MIFAGLSVTSCLPLGTMAFQGFSPTIDIMEAPAYARKNNGIVQQALHIEDYNRGTGSSTFSMNWLTENIGDLYDSFHTYGLFSDVFMLFKSTL